jgi:hypothetical protein
MSEKKFIRMKVYKILSHPVSKKGAPVPLAPRSVRSSYADRKITRRMLQPSVVSLTTWFFVYMGITEMVMGQGYEPGFAFSARMNR